MTPGRVASAAVTNILRNMTWGISTPLLYFYVGGSGFAGSSRLFAHQISVKQLLGIFHAVELQQACIFFDEPIQRHADGPGARESLGIVYRGCVFNMIFIDERITLGH